MFLPGSLLLLFSDRGGLLGLHRGPWSFLPDGLTFFLAVRQTHTGQHPSKSVSCSKLRWPELVAKRRGIPGTLKTRLTYL